MASRKRICSLICFLSLISTWCESVEYEPWIGNYLEFEWRNSLLYQSYPVVASHSKLINYSSSDFFLTTNLSNAVKPEFSVGLEATAARTRKQSWGIDNFRLAGRYVWLDDIAGDPISLTTGVNLTQAFLSSLKDISSFHHGRSEAEFFVSLGKEKASDEQWISRWWTVLGMGVAEIGSPWLRGNIAYEYRLCLYNELRFFMNTLWGMGHQRLRIHDFDGYGSLQHQSVDIGFRYTRLIEFFGNVNFEYTYRAYARNFPAQTHRFLLTLLYTFGL